MVEDGSLCFVDFVSSLLTAMIHGYASVFGSKALVIE